MFSSKRQFVLSFRKIDILLEMQSFIKFVLLSVVIATTFCKQCDEDIIGFQKIGMHRKFNLNFKYLLKVTSTLCNNNKHFCLISRLN